MAQSSHGFSNYDPEEDADNLPLQAEDRASTRINSPNFELPADEPAPAPSPTPNLGGSPFASALADFQPQEPVQDAQLVQDAPEAPRLKGADNPELGGAIQAFESADQLTEPMAPPRAGYEDAWIAEQNRRDREGLAQSRATKAGASRYLRAQGVEMDTLPDGSQVIASHEDGAPRFKAATSAPFQDESDNWQVRSRSDRGDLADVPIQQTKGLLHINPQTGDQYFVGADKQPVIVGQDQRTLDALALHEKRAEYAGQIAARNVKLGELQQGLSQARAMRISMLGSSVGDGSGKTVRALQNSVDNLQPLIDAGTAEPDQVADFNEKSASLEKWKAAHPEYGQIKDTIRSTAQVLGQMQYEQHQDRLRKTLVGASPGVSAAVASMMPSGMLDAHPGPGEASAASVDADTTATAAQTRSPQSQSLPGVLLKLKAAGVSTISSNGKAVPIDEVIAAAKNPPAVVSKEEPPAEEPKAPEGVWQHIVNAAKIIGRQIGGGTAKSLAGTIDFDQAGEYTHLTPAQLALEEKKASAEVEAAKAQAPQSVMNYLANVGSETPDNSAFGVAARRLSAIQRAKTIQNTLLDPQVWRAALTPEELAKDYGTDPAKENTGLAMAARVAGDVTGIVAKGPLAMPDIVARASFEGAEAAEAAARAKGVTNAAQLQLAREAGRQHGAGIAAATLPLYLASGGASSALTQLPFLAGRSALTRAAVGGASTAVGNMAASATVRGIEGEPIIPTLEQAATDIAFGAIHAKGEYSAVRHADKVLDGTDPAVAKLAAVAADASNSRETRNKAAGVVNMLKEQAAKIRGQSAATPTSVTSAPDSEPPEETGGAPAPNGTPPKTPAPAAASPPPLPKISSPADFEAKRGEADAIRERIQHLRDYGGPEGLPEGAAQKDALNANQQALASHAQATTGELPPELRERIAKTVSPDGSAAAGDAHFAAQPEAAFMAADVGRNLRGLYLDEADARRVREAGESVGHDAEIAHFVADQHVGLAVGRDLADVIAGKPLGETKAKAFADLGLLDLPTDGSPAVPTDDALKLLPPAFAQRPEVQVRLNATPGHAQDGAALLVRGGQRYLAEALRGRETAQKAAKTKPDRSVKVSFTDKSGQERETVIPATGNEEQAKATAEARVEKSGNKVRGSEIMKAETKGEEKKLSSTQATLSPADAKPFIDFANSIPEAELYHEEPGKGDSYGPEYGREDKPHVTALYGLHGQDSAHVEDALRKTGQGPIKLRVGKLSLFENADKPYDVLKADIDSPDLHALNTAFRKLPHSSDFPDYHPHLTIAYLKKGEGAKYAGDARFEGKEITVPKLTFSDAERNHTQIALAKEIEATSPSQEVKPTPSGEHENTPLPEPKEPAKGQPVTWADAKLTDFTPDGQAAIKSVEKEFQRQAKFFRALGVKGFRPVKFGAETGGIMLGEDGVLRVDGEHLVSHFADLKRQGVKPADWTAHALNEEQIHAAQFKAAGPGWREHYEEVRRELPQEMIERAGELYSGFERLGEAEQAMEVERMLIQHGWKGGLKTITESLYRSIERLVKYLSGFDLSETPLLKKSLERAQSLLDDARAESEEPANESAVASGAAVEVPVKGLTLSREVPNFKAGATEKADAQAKLEAEQRRQDVRVGASKPLRAGEDIRPERDMFGADKAEGDDLFDKGAREADTAAENAKQDREQQSLFEPPAKAEPPQRSAAEVLDKEARVKLTVPKGATAIRVTPAKGKPFMETVGNVGKGANVLKGVGPFAKIEPGTIGRKGEFVPMAGEVAAVPAAKGGLAAARMIPLAEHGDTQSNEYFTDDQNWFHEKVLRRIEEHDETQVTAFARHIAERTKWPKAGVVLKGVEARDGMMATVTPISKPGAPFQVTFFDTGADEMARPFGDVPVDSLQDGIREAFRRKFTDTSGYPQWQPDAGVGEEPSGMAGDRPGDVPERAGASRAERVGALAASRLNRTGGGLPEEPFERAQKLRRELGDRKAAESVGLTSANVDDFLFGTNETGINPHGLGETGLSMEIAKRMPGAPKPEEIPSRAPSTPSKPAGTPSDVGPRIVDAIRELRRQSRFRDVLISDVQRQSGVPLADLHAWIREAASRGEINPTRQDWSLASKEAQAASIHLAGEPHLAIGLTAKGEQRYGAGTSNLTAGVEKNISDARLMRPADPAGFLREMAQRARAKGDTDTAKNMEAAAIQSTYRDLAAESKFPSVRIADLAKRAGLPLDQVKEHLHRQWRAGKVQLEKGDWSLASPETRAGAVTVNGDKMLLARFNDPATEDKPQGMLAAARVPRPEDTNEEAVRAAARRGSPISAVIRAATPGLELGRDVKQGLQSLLLPSAKSPEHLNAAEVLGSKLGAMHHRAEGSNAITDKFLRMFEKLGVKREGLPIDQNAGIKFMSDRSTGRKVAPQFQELAEIADRQDAARLAHLEAAGAPLQTIRENYFPGIWTAESRRAFNQAMEEAREQGVIAEGTGVNNATPEEKAWVKARVDKLLESGQGSDKDALGYLTKSPFKGKEGFRKQKVFDQDIKTAFEFGLRAVSNNPVDIMRLKWAEMDRNIMANEALAEWARQGKLKFLKLGEQVPDGWQKVDDRYGTVWGPREIDVTARNSRLIDKATGQPISLEDAGLESLPPEGTTLKARPFGRIQIGNRIVPNAVGDVLNNYLSSSLYNNPYFGKLYKGWMGFANVLNQAQLGVGSAFHAGFTTMEAQISAGANVLKDVFGLVRGNRSIGHVLGSVKQLGIATGETAYTGDKVLNAWRRPDGVIDPRIKQVVEAAELAGGGFTMERGLQTDQLSKMVSDWYSGHEVRAALRSPVAGLELLAKPIMSYLVPRQKAGVFAHLAWRIIEQNPGVALPELRPQFRQAWNRVDARLGQVRYDRLFMNNVAKNVIQGTVRAPGWTGGTIAELGGSIKDAYGFFRQWQQTGRLPADIPDRVAYAASLLLTAGLANAVLTYAFTGKQPEGLDYWAFRTGGEDEHGNPERFILPTYMKDILAYAKEPITTLINKTHPLASLLLDLYRNKDYYGVEVRHEDDGAIQQALQSGKYVAKAFVPFWIRGQQREAERHAGALRQVLPMAGVMPAPKKMTQTPAERLADHYAQLGRQEGPLTQKQADANHARYQLVQAIRRGEHPDFSAAIQAGYLKRDQVSALRSRAAMTPLQYQVKRLGLDQANAVFEKASPKEQEELRRIMREKREHAAARK